MANKIKIKVELTRAQLEEEKIFISGGDSLEIKDVESIKEFGNGLLEESMFVEPVTAVVVASVAVIAKRMVDDWLQSKEQGMQIDLRKDPPVFSRISNVPRGFVVIIDKEGNAKAEQAHYKSSKDLVPILSKLIKS